MTMFKTEKQRWQIDGPAVEEEIPPMPQDGDERRAVTARFPPHTFVRLKPGAPTNQTTRLRKARVVEVVATGIHLDVFLKVGRGMDAHYLDPRWYEIDEAAEEEEDWRCEMADGSGSSMFPFR